MTSKRATLGPSTLAIHADRAHNPTNAVSPAIFQTSTFRWDSPDDGARFAAEQHPSEFYTRSGNPNVRQLEALVASLEGAEGALATASGMSAAAISVVPFVTAGDHVLGARTLYGDVNALITKVLPKFGIEGTLVASTRAEDYAAAMRPRTRVIVIETPANPTLDCVDIAAIAKIARDAGARLVVDSTFATPINTRPLEFGAHAVFHSATKYLGGHSDVTAGVFASDAESIAQAWEYVRILGPSLGPIDAWLVTRGIRTLPLRMARHNDNGQRLAEYLAAHSRVAHVNYPGLPAHASHAIARRQMKAFGAMISLELQGGESAARAFVGALELFTPATSLGGVESLVQFPAVLSRMSPEKQRAAGVSPGLVRLSVGCEDAVDLIADLERALG